MNRKLSDSLSYVDDRYIARAAKKPKKASRILFPALAAVLALVLLLKIPSLPLAISAQAVATAPATRREKRPKHSDPRWEEWYDTEMRRQEQTEAAAPAVTAFAQACSRSFLTEAPGENRVWAPFSAYLSLAMTAELTGSHTQALLLDTLGARDLNTLRRDMGAAWEQLSWKDGKEICLLSTSLWMDEDLDYQQETMDLLADSYYADLYRSDLDSKKAARDVGRWLHNATQGALGTPEIQLENTQLLLLSTVYFQSKWAEPFSRSQSKAGVFHSAEGDMDCTFMNARELHQHYYWGEDFGAIALRLKNGSQMWLILPDEDKTIADVLERGEYAALFSEDTQQRAYKKVNLSLPKFDIDSEASLRPALESMGLGELFEPLGNDFTPSIISSDPTFLENIRQQSRVTVDEEGVTAASYLELDFGAGAAQPPEEIIDFVLDRPFLFAITKNTVPLFMGTVEKP